MEDENRNIKVEKRKKDKSQRAIYDNVLDAKTVAILNSLMKRELLEDLRGCISTGKEANVYAGIASLKLTSKLINKLKKKEVIRKTKDHDASLTTKSVEELTKLYKDLDNKIITYKKLKRKNKFHQEENENEQNEMQNTFNDSNTLDTIKNTDQQYQKYNKEQDTIDRLDNPDHSINEMVYCAIKIFQTSKMLFKDRLKYIEGEMRFQTFCSSNPRKLVKLWAEKEVRNLKRLNKCGIPSPVPLYLKKNIIIMTLLLEDESYKNRINDKSFIPTASPRLKDYRISDLQEAIFLYQQSLDLIYRMYNQCNLIHSDFSEYNLVVVKHQDKPVLHVIDMGQAVESSHVNCNDFLLMDIHNINGFFNKLGVNVKSNNEIFQEITGKMIPVCLQNIEIHKNFTVIDRLDDVYNHEDYKHFLKTNTENISEVQNQADELHNVDYNGDEQSLDDLDIENNNINCSDAAKGIKTSANNIISERILVKERKKIFKEIKKIKRLSKRPKKDKKKTQKLNKIRKK